MMRTDQKKQDGNPVDKLAGSALEYLSMKIDEVKLQGVEGLSVFFGRAIVVAVMMIFGGIAFLFAGFALAYRLGAWLGSNPLGFVLVGAFFLILTLLLFLFRKRMFVNAMVTFFIRLFFNRN